MSNIYLWNKSKLSTDSFVIQFLIATCIYLTYLSAFNSLLNALNICVIWHLRFFLRLWITFVRVGMDKKCSISKSAKCLLRFSKFLRIMVSTLCYRWIVSKWRYQYISFSKGKFSMDQGWFARIIDSILSTCIHENGQCR